MKQTDHVHILVRTKLQKLTRIKSCVGIQRHVLAI